MSVVLEARLSGAEAGAPLSGPNGEGRREVRTGGSAAGAAGRRKACAGESASGGTRRDSVAAASAGVVWLGVLQAEDEAWMVKDSGGSAAEWKRLSGDGLRSEKELRGV